MKKVVVFFCDIDGTYTPSEVEERNEFQKILNDFKNSYKADDIIFSFITGDSNEDYLKNYVNDFKKRNIDEKIILGNQYYDCGMYDENGNHKSLYGTKESKIINYLDFLKSKYDIVKVIFADDNINALSQEKISRKFGYTIDITIMRPDYIINDASQKVITSKKEGLSGVIDCLKFLNDNSIINKIDKTNYIGEKEKEEIKKLEQERLETEKKQLEELERKIEKTKVNSIFFPDNNLDNDDYFSYLCNESFDIIDESEVEIISSIIDQNGERKYNIRDIKEELEMLKEINDNALEYIEFLKMYKTVIYPDSITSMKDKRLYSDELFKELLQDGEYEFSWNGFRESLHFFPEDSSNELDEIMEGHLYPQSYTLGKEYKLSNTYTINEIRAVMQEINLIAFLIIYNNKIKFRGGDYFVKCNMHKRDNNFDLRAYTYSKQLYCSDCGWRQNLLKYILKSEWEMNKNLIGIYELMDTLICFFNISSVQIRENPNVNEILLRELIIACKSDTYKSFLDDEANYKKNRCAVKKHNK